MSIRDAEEDLNAIRREINDLKLSIQRSPTENFDIFITGELDPITLDEIVELIGKLYEKIAGAIKVGESTKQRQQGIYFTERNLADSITRDALDNFPVGFIPNFLEPSAGLGAFVFSFLRVMHERNQKMSEIDWQSIANHIFIVEKDTESIEILKWLIPEYIR